MISDSRARLKRVWRPAGPPEERTAEQIVEDLLPGLEARAAERHSKGGLAERPWVLLNVASTADGRASLEGRSGGIGDAADRQLFHALRTAVDAVLVGAGTARAEHYGRLIKSEEGRALRRSRGLAEEPLACIVSGRPELLADVPLLAEPDAKVAILTSSTASLPASQAQVSCVRAGQAGAADLAAALRELAQGFAVRTLLCEGGPHLNGELVAAGLLDELFLTLAPKLAGGALVKDSLRIVGGADLVPPVQMRLVEVFEHRSELVLHYAIDHPAMS